jgi:hypothetical protein
MLRLSLCHIHIRWSLEAVQQYRDDLLLSVGVVERTIMLHVIVDEPRVAYVWC